jgi:signal transduction histidine kinase
LKFASHALRICFAILVGYFVAKLNLDSVEFFLFDLRTHYRPAPADTEKLALVYTTPSTVEALQGPPTFDDQSKVLQAILAADPLAVVYVSNIKAWKGDLKDQKKFAELASETGTVFFPTDQLALKGEEGKSQFSPPLDALQVVPGPKTADATRFGKDNVTRRIVVSFQDQKMLHPLIAERINPEISDLANIQGQFLLYDSVQTFIDFRPLNSYPKVSFEKVGKADFDSGLFKGRIVILGDDTGLDKRDYLYTPMAREKDVGTLAEMHANIFETLIRNSAPVRAPDWLNYFLCILISLLTVHVVLLLRPLKGIIILLGAVLSFTILAYVAFTPFHFWIDMAHPFLTIFLCYYFFIPYRLIVENRKSWEYFQKHKLLSEVETLKTNFIGMMSHDLKTPLARIQGMTDVIQKDQTPLSSGQREALDTIHQSSDDLLKSISTILNYAKIESEGVELHLQAKDINQLLKEVVKKHEFLAKLKHIQLIAELEPLFSLQIDPVLMKQVLSNLVENAIKYSPEKFEDSNHLGRGGWQNSYSGLRPRNRHPCRRIG